MKWRKARKIPVIIKFREVVPDERIYNNATREYVLCEKIETREVVLYGFKDRDFIIEDIEGEIYPISKKIFYKTYNVIKDE